LHYLQVYLFFVLQHTDSMFLYRGQTYIWCWCGRCGVLWHPM